MRRETELSLLREVLRLHQEGRRPLDGEESRVPTTRYLDPARFQEEQARVFRPAYNLAALGAKLASPGDFVSTELLGSPVLIARGEHGRLRAFLNVCRHRGATVELRPEGRCRRFVCPYHAWSYENDGRLHRVRHPEGFPALDPFAHGLVELPCLEAAGLVFVCPTPGATPEPLPPALVQELEGLLGPAPTLYARTARTWAANWKLIVEGGIESYHFRIAHKDSIAPYFEDTRSTWARLGAHLRSVLPRRSVAALAELPEDQWRIREHTHLVYTLHPNAMLLLQRAHFDLVLLRPLAVDRTQVEVWTLGPSPASPEQQGYLEKNHAISVRTLDEDFVLAEQIQRGLATPANTHLRFGRFEGALTDWHRQLEGLLSLEPAL
ncbi:MAG: Rieske 2Fe-2S domain-containing protein [Alphaproteobacteria bacterium]|nr:Rieske 2Fe-2S domain-containing protein [Alphaproteobacteria bacterium]